MLSLQTNALIEEVKSGNLRRVKELVDANPSLAGSVKSGATAILWALYTGHRDIAEYLATKKELDIFESASLGMLDRVKALLAQDPGLVRSYSEEGFPALGLASHLGEKEVVMYLIENGADVNAVGRGTGFTALTGAISGGHREIAELLLSKGANVNHRYEAGFSPLLIAAENGDVEMVKLLISHGADVNARTTNARTPLSFALEKGHHEMVKLLRENEVYE